MCRLKRVLESISVQVLHSCCCVLNVHRRFDVAYLIKHAPDGKSHKELRRFNTLTPDLLQLIDWLQRRLPCQNDLGAGSSCYRKDQNVPGAQYQRLSKGRVFKRVAVAAGYSIWWSTTTCWLSRSCMKKKEKTTSFTSTTRKSNGDWSNNESSSTLPSIWLRSRSSSGFFLTEACPGSERRLFLSLFCVGFRGKGIMTSRLKESPISSSWQNKILSVWFYTNSIRGIDGQRDLSHQC